LTVMRWTRLIVGELILLFASILVFRSAWTLLDEYLGKSNLWLMLVLGIVLTIIALILLDYEVKCELEKKGQV
jgi:magnesium-transporting ATPase (P-type)